MDLSTDEKEIIQYIHNSCFVCEICYQNLSNSIYYTPNSHDEDVKNLRFQCKKCHEIASTICSVRLRLICFLSFSYLIIDVF